MTVRLNGHAIELEDSASVADAVARAGAGGERRGVAVAIDGEVIPRGEWTERRVNEGERVEALAAMQGG